MNSGSWVRAKIIRIVVSIGILLFCGGGNAENYSLLEGGKGNRAKKNQYDVFFISVDGNQLFNKKKHKLSSGSHYINIASSKSRRTSRNKTISYRGFQLDLKPCIRYIMSARYASSEIRNNNWELVINEEKIDGCVIEKSIESESQAFNVLDDSRTNNFQAEIYAISLGQYIGDKLRNCPELSQEKALIDWLKEHQFIITASDLQIKNFVADKMMLTGADATRKVWSIFQNLLYNEFQNNINKFGAVYSCAFPLNELKPLNSLWPYSEVYKKLTKSDPQKSLHQEYWKKALKAIKDI